MRTVSAFLKSQICQFPEGGGTKRMTQKVHFHKNSHWVFRFWGLFHGPTFNSDSVYDACVVNNNVWVLLLIIMH